MKKPLAHTKVTVKLRKSQYKEEWYLIVEAYPVVKAGNKVERIVESVNRTITTPIWDKSSSTRSSGFKPKRDINGIIMCRSTLDQESCIYADNVRKEDYLFSSPQFFRFHYCQLESCSSSP